MSNFEEKVLSTLEQHGKMLEQQGKTLEQHGEILGQHGKILESLVGKVSNLEADVTVLKADVSVMKDDVAVLKDDVAYVKVRAESASESVAVIEVDHGQKIGALFDAVSRLRDITGETNTMVKAMHEKQENQELSIKWIDSRLKKSG